VVAGPGSGTLLTVVVLLVGTGAGVALAVVVGRRPSKGPPTNP